MDLESEDGKDGVGLHLNCAKLNEILDGRGQHQRPQLQAPSEPKKQVRRRCHATRSYQGRVLNMAEARKEIVAALKIHRASMKAIEQQKKQQNQLLLQQEVSSPLSLAEESQREKKSKISTRIYPSSTITNNLSYSIGNSFQSPSDFPGTSYTKTIETGMIFQDLGLTSPNKQPFSLHLNLHSFSKKHVTSDNCTINSSVDFSPSSPSVLHSPTSSSSLRSSYASATISASPNLKSRLTEEIGNCETSKQNVVEMLHPVMDEEKMAEIRLIGERHDIEWNDKLNMDTLAWWCRFFKSHELGGSVGTDQQLFHDAGGREEAMVVSPWIIQQHANNMQCLDTGDTEQMGGGWS